MLSYVIYCDCIFKAIMNQERALDYHTSSSWDFLYSGLFAWSMRRRRLQTRLAWIEEALVVE